MSERHRRSVDRNWSWEGRNEAERPNLEAAKVPLPPLPGYATAKCQYTNNCSLLFRPWST